MLNSIFIRPVGGAPSVKSPSIRAVAQTADSTQGGHLFSHHVPHTLLELLQSIFTYAWDLQLHESQVI